MIAFLCCSALVIFFVYHFKTQQIIQDLWDENQILKRYVNGDISVKIMEAINDDDKDETK